MADWKDKRVVVVGAARQGLALARYLARHGAQVVLNDRRPAAELQPVVESLLLPAVKDYPGSVKLVFGSHSPGILGGVDLVCPSGGVPLTSPLILEARRRGIALSNDSQIFLEAAPCKVIGITGSAGKTTTTTLVGRIAQVAAAEAGSGVRAYIGGNIGNPLINDVDNMHAQDVAVMELSSFQLEIMTQSPQVSAVLNITPNHLDRHASMEEYTAAKARILDFQAPGDRTVLNREDHGSWSLRNQGHGILLSFGRNAPEGGQVGTYLQNGHIMLQTETEANQLFPVGLVGLRGEHNVLNVLAACAISAAAGFSPAAMRTGVKGFRGVPHRLEFVRTYKGVDWYNDSIATAPERSIAAVRSFNEPLVLLAGGRDKNLPWEEFARLIRQRVDHLILFGEAVEKISRAVENSERSGSRPITLTKCKDLQEAVFAAAELAPPGSVVLLAPGGTSFDEFIDFEERGEAFRQWVQNLP
jgi:UDP-N-acetylmuramoylalanine--D-glutamate ligase